ncbi:MAG: alpha/beta hydrolase [Anaerolineae bacterium]|nr:alpha/beta hydrolase [Anaerolineae bacterium]
MAGPPDGQPIFLLHGFPEFWYGWRVQIPALAKAGYRVIIPDQRGYNLSDKPKDIKTFRVDNCVADLLGLIDALGYDKVYLIGHDWGGVVAWAFALGHSNRLYKLGIMNTPHPKVMSRFLRRDPEQIRRFWYFLFFQLPWLPEYLLRKDDWGNTVRMLLGSNKRSSFSIKDIEEYKQAWSQPGAMTSMLNWYRAAIRYPPKLPRDLHVHIPTLMIWGVKDIALSHRMARPSLDYCDNGTLVFFEDATHWVQHDEAEAVNQLLLEFFSRKQSGRNKVGNKK